MAQSSYALTIEALDKAPSFVKENLEYPTSLFDSVAVDIELQRIILELHGQAYLEASFDRIERNKKETKAYLHVGEQYKWAQLKNGNVEDVFLEQIGFREQLYSGKPFHFKEVRKLQESLLSYAEDNGYPFAAVWLDSIEVKNGEIAAQLFMRKNKLILIDEVKVTGNAKVSQAYLTNYLGIKKGTLYSKSKILKIRNRIKELPFIKEVRDLSITFKGEQATINLYLNKKKASRFDFLIGLAPNSDQFAIRRFLITGTFNADMHNQFGLGERIFAEFQQLRPGTQDLEIELAYPYVLNLPFGVETSFDLYKRDTSYLDVIYDVGIQYLFEGGNYIKAYWNTASTTLLSIDEDRIRNTKSLPKNLDLSNASFGLEYALQRLDYRFNPRKGWSIFARGGAGFKRIKENSAITGIQDSSEPMFEFRSLYDSLETQTFQYKVDLKIERYFPFFKRTTLKTAVELGGIISEQSIFQNEQYRIGGNRRLRGFDEEAVQASRFAIFTLEYRFLIGQNAYLYAFGDYGYVEDRTNEVNRTDRPIGFGAGMTFDTKVGVFGISYALGRRFDDPIDFRAAKIHFGYVSLF